MNKVNQSKISQITHFPYDTPVQDRNKKQSDISIVARKNKDTVSQIKAFCSQKTLDVKNPTKELNYVNNDSSFRAGSKHSNSLTASDYSYSEEIYYCAETVPYQRDSQTPINEKNNIQNSEKGNNHSIPTIQKVSISLNERDVSINNAQPRENSSGEFSLGELTSNKTPFGNHHLRESDISEPLKNKSTTFPSDHPTTESFNINQSPDIPSYENNVKYNIEKSHTTKKYGYLAAIITAAIGAIGAGITVMMSHAKGEDVENDDNYTQQGDDAGDAAVSERVASDNDAYADALAIGDTEKSDAIAKDYNMDQNGRPIIDEANLNDGTKASIRETARAEGIENAKMEAKEQLSTGIEAGWGASAGLMGLGALIAGVVKYKNNQSKKITATPTSKSPVIDMPSAMKARNSFI